MITVKTVVPIKPRYVLTFTGRSDQVQLDTLRLVPISYLGPYCGQPGLLYTD